MHRVRGPSRVQRAGIAAAVLGVSLTGLVAAPAQADILVDAGTIGELQTALTGCAGTSADPLVITITATISAAGDAITVPCYAILDLGAFSVDLRRVEVTSGNRLVVRSSGAGEGQLTAVATTLGQAAIWIETATLQVDSGVVNATGYGGGAGIGGDDGQSGGHFVMNGGTVNASVAGSGGAGIGSGQNGGQCGVTIHGGTVNADDGTVIGLNFNLAAAIGGGENAPSCTTYIDGGTVNALGGNGIGNGNGAFTLPLVTAGSITITGDAVVNVSAGLGTGIGWTHSNGTDPGAVPIVEISGTAKVTAESGSSSFPGSSSAIQARTFELDLGATATLRYRTAASPAATSMLTVTESAEIAGDLVIEQGSWEVDSAVMPTIAATGRVLGPAGDETGGGALSGTGTIANAGVIAFTADRVSPTVTGQNHLVTFVPASGPTTQVRVFAQDFQTGFRSIPATLGEWNTALDGTGSTLTATTALSGDPTYYETADPAEIASLDAPATATQGSTITAVPRTSGGAAIPLLPGMQLVSDHACDVIAGLSVTFGCASPHQLTLLVGGVPVATAVVQVAGALPATGGAPIGAALAAAAIALVGLAFLGVRRLGVRRLGRG